MTSPLPPHLDREVVRALRGRRARQVLSERLGYSFNQVYLWESGRRQIFWSDFEALCAALNRPLADALHRHFAANEIGRLQDLFRQSLGQRKKKDVAAQLGIPLSRLSRWLHGKSDPPLAEVFRFLSLVHLNFPEFLDDVVGPGRLDSIQPVVQRQRRIGETLFREPLSALVVPALGLQEYLSLKRHDPGVLARKLGLPVRRVEQLIVLLEEAGMLELHEGKYRARPYAVNLRNDPGRFLRNCQFWAEQAARVPKKTGRKSAFGYRIFGTSEAGRRKIRQAQVDYYNALTEIIREENGPFDHVMVVNFQAFLPEETD